MKNYKIGLLLLFTAFVITSSAQTVLYVSKQTGQSTKFTGNYSRQTDRYEQATGSFSTTGPVTYTLEPNEFFINPNENKNWIGTIGVDVANAPSPGSEVAAQLTINYNLHYSRPYGSGSDGSVESTYSCGTTNAAGSSSGGCAYHSNNPGTHEIVNKSGINTTDLKVVSILAQLPDTICLDASGQKTVTATVFPLVGGNYEWTSTHPKVSIANSNSPSATITLSDTSVKGATVKLTYSIEGVKYTATAVLAVCNCSCQPITNGVSLGPVTVSFNANATASTPDADGFCTYSNDNASFSATLNGGAISRNATFNNGVKVSVKKNCENGTYDALKIDWDGEVEVPELEIRGVKVFKMKVKGVHIQVNTSGNLSGTVTVNVANAEDRDLSFGKKFIMLRKGTNSDITFTYNNENSWAGAFNWSGLNGILVELCKQSDGNEVKLASFSGNMSNEGDVTGNFNVNGQPSYKSNLFKVTLKSLTLGCEMKLSDGSFRLTSGSGSVEVSEMKALTGSIALGLDFPEAGGCNATVNASQISAFTMTLDEFNLQANFNADFDITTISGSLKAKHNKFDAKIEVADFKVENGSLSKFACSGQVKYSAFKFTLENGSYTTAPASLLSISSKVEMSATGTAAMLAVDKFQINEAGEITIGKISGSLNRAPASMSFSATFGSSRFTGSFSGDFAGIGLDGTVDIGSNQTPEFGFAYLAITAKTNVPLGQTGLKLTQIGGMLGYNYQLNAPNPATGTYPDPPGNPTQGRYLAGLKLGVADVANMCEVTGSTVVAFGAGNIDITLAGTVAILKNNQFFQGGCNVTYSIPSQTLSGSVGAALKIPSSGFLLSTGNPNPTISFFLGQEGNSKVFKASSNAMSGSMFGDKIQLTGGSFSLNGNLDNILAVTGSLKGRASADFSFAPSLMLWGSGISGTLNMHMRSDIDAAFNASGLAGSFAVHVDGDGSITVTPFFGSITVGGSASCDGSVGYNNGSVSLTGDVSITLPNIPWYGDLTVSTGVVSINL